MTGNSFRRFLWAILWPMEANRVGNCPSVHQVWRLQVNNCVSFRSGSQHLQDSLKCVCVNQLPWIRRAYYMRCCLILQATLPTNIPINTYNKFSFKRLVCPVCCSGHSLLPTLCFSCTHCIEEMGHGGRRYTILNSGREMLEAGG